jgi:hypothetical protein
MVGDLPSSTRELEAFFFSNQIHFVFKYLTQVSDGFIISHDFV